MPARLNIQLQRVRKRARRCEACPLYARATQTVFGEGPAPAPVMLIGEQPGDSEDLAGHPFVGPAGKLLDQVLEGVGIDREQLYLTNTVKHFSWAPRGKRRLHKKPLEREIAACRPWLDQELALVQPQLVVCLGATAAKALLGGKFRVTEQRGHVLDLGRSYRALATLHPSAILRAPGDARTQAMQSLAEDLALIKPFFTVKNGRGGRQR
jgi:DNA polymerase